MVEIFNQIESKQFDIQFKATPFSIESLCAAKKGSALAGALQQSATGRRQVLLSC